MKIYLGYRPPYRYKEILDFMAGRAIPGVEFVKDGEYFRSVNLENLDKELVKGWIKIAHAAEKNALELTLSKSLLSLIPQVEARVSYLFDLHCDPETVHEKLASMNEIRPGLCLLGTRLPGSFNAFEMAVRAVLGQQISVKAATTLAGRFVKAFGIPVKHDIPELSHLFPGPEDILALDGAVEDHLTPLGITLRRAGTIGELAGFFKEKDIDFWLCSEPEAEIENLLKIPGIGPWTAKYIAMRSMGWRDAFLETDAGIKKALAAYSAKDLVQISEAWRPWRSYATMNLWNSL